MSMGAVHAADWARQRRASWAGCIARCRGRRCSALSARRRFRRCRSFRALRRSRWSCRRRIADRRCLSSGSCCCLRRAGVLEHSGIKIPYFAFFSHDSGKRPQEAPFNMLLAMGLAAALCILIGLYPGWLYQLLPFRDQAHGFLAQDLFSTCARDPAAPAAGLRGAGLHAAAVAASCTRPKQPGVIIDVEWLWRKGGPMLGRALAGPARAGGRVVSPGGFGRSLSGIQQRRGRSSHRTAGYRAKVPLSATAVWSLAILGIVMLVSLFR